MFANVHQPMQPHQNPYAYMQAAQAPIPPAVARDRAEQSQAAAAGAAAGRQQGGGEQQENNKPDMAGQLYKQKHSITKTMEKLHMELHGSELRYYALDASKAVPRRVINVKGCRCSNGQTTALLKHFVVHTPNDGLRDYYVLAHESEEEVKRWRAALEAAAAAPQKPATEGAAERSDACKVVALVNSKSGGKQGAALIAKLQRHLGEQNVRPFQRRFAAGEYEAF